MVPTALRDRDKWVCWRYEERGGRTAKVPLFADEPGRGRVDATDPKHWTDFETATRTVNQDNRIEGLGFVFNTDGPIVGVDLDECRDPVTGAIEPRAQEIVDQLDVYTEVSPSGTGLHCYLFADRGIPGNRNRSGDVEIYSGDRFFTVTGNRLEGVPKCVTTAQTELEAIYNEHITDDETTPLEPVHAAQTTTSGPLTTTLEDQELIEKAKNAKSGDKFRRVWRGDYSHHRSHSEARLELYNYLAFWTGKDEQQMWHLFQQSGLYPHPDEPGTCDRLKDREISKAVVDTRNSYDPEYHVDGDQHPDDETEVVTADGGRLTVSDPTVVRVLEAVEELGEASTSKIGEHDVVDRGDRQVRRAIKYLEENGVLESQRNGRSISYSLLD
jgi:putative DNA primase/helicase